MIRLCRYLLIVGTLLLSGTAAAQIDNYANAQLMALKAKSLVGHQQTSTPPGNDTDKQTARRGGPYAAHVNEEAGCGGIAIGNVRPVVGDHRKHETTVIIQGHIINTGNRC